jgi:hypothetical protein
MTTVMLAHERFDSSLPLYQEWRNTQPFGDFEERIVKLTDFDRSSITYIGDVLDNARNNLFSFVRPITDFQDGRLSGSFS